MPFLHPGASPRVNYNPAIPPRKGSVRNTARYDSEHGVSHVQALESRLLDLEAAYITDMLTLARRVIALEIAIASKCKALVA